MSPITEAARQRILEYFQTHPVPHSDVPPPKPAMLRVLLDHLIEAVRAEQPEDRGPF